MFNSYSTFNNQSAPKSWFCSVFSPLERLLMWDCLESLQVCLCVSFNHLIHEAIARPFLLASQLAINPYLLPTQHSIQKIALCKGNWPLRDTASIRTLCCSSSPGVLALSNTDSSVETPAGLQVAGGVTHIKWNEVSFPGGSDGKASACSAGDPGSIPGLGRSPGEGNGTPLQYSCLENPVDWGAW